MIDRLVGNCQICEGDYKLHAGRLVHHGYKRPGYGYIVGDCPGVGHPPYEVSRDRIDAVRTGAEKHLVETQDRLADFEGGRVSQFVLEEWVHARQRRELVDYVRGVSDAYRFDQASKQIQARLRAEVAQLKALVQRFTERWNKWKPMPLRTVREMEATASGARAGRSAEAAERRAAKTEKQRALQAKRDALAQKRQAMVDDVIARLRALDDEPPSSRRFEDALRIAAELKTRKFSFLMFPLHELKIDDVLLRLGLAYRLPNDSYIRYR